jgi:hypothetical protein
MDLPTIFTPDFKDQLEALTYIVGIVSVVLGSLIYFVTRTIPWLRERANQRVLQSRLGLEAYSDQQLRRAFRHYVSPKCQQIDPAGHEESRALGLVQEPLFDAMARELERTGEVRYLILLADSGMGKTSAVLNFCARHLRGPARSKYKVRVVHLGSPDSDDLIASTEDKANTVLFLDALDEDTRAIENHSARLDTLLAASRRFRALVITCRTQFFARDEEIPRETGVIKSGPRSAGEGAEYLFHKLYLSPFSDHQVREYLHKRYPVWQRRDRARAFAIVEQIPHLSARPMLLAHVDDLLRTNRTFQFTVEVYSEMVNAWIQRESGFIRDPASLLTFSKRLAADLYLNRENRGAERIRREDIGALAVEWGIDLDKWALTGRSLLNRDSEGFYKFAHRSILEYLFVARFLDGDDSCAEVEWTDQMLRFLAEHFTIESEAIAVVSARIRPRSSFHLTLIRLLISGMRHHQMAPSTVLAGLMTLVSKWLLDSRWSAKIGIYDRETKQSAAIPNSWMDTETTHESVVFVRHLFTPVYDRFLVMLHLPDVRHRKTAIQRIEKLSRQLGSQGISVHPLGTHTQITSRYPLMLDGGSQFSWGDEPPAG